MATSSAVGWSSRHTRSKRRARQNQHAQDAMEIEEDGRERKRLARRYHLSTCRALPSLFPFPVISCCFFQRREFYLPPRFWVLPCITDNALEECARTREFIFFGPPHPFLPSRRTNPKPPPLVHTYPIALCFPQSVDVKHVS